MYYVYEWYRGDLNLPYYIGKGSGERAYDLERNDHTNKVTKYLIGNGIKREVRILAWFLTEEKALEFEVERIAFWWYLTEHDILTNKTKGGEGVSGLKMSDEARAKMSAKAKGRPGVKSMLGRKHSEETKSKMRAAKVGKKPNNYGKKVAPEKTVKYSERMKKLWQDPEHRKKAIRTEVSEETRAKLSLAATSQWADPNKRPNRKREKLS